MSTVRLFAAIVIGGGGLMLAGTGCSSDNADRPYALTGTTPTYSTSTAERLAWTDEKGHYRSDWQAGINRPPEYPKAVSTNYTPAP